MPNSIGQPTCPFCARSDFVNVKRLASHIAWTHRGAYGYPKARSMATQEWIAAYQLRRRIANGQDTQFHSRTGIRWLAAQRETPTP